MKYAITFTRFNDWDSVDTFLVETIINPLDMSKQELISMFNEYIDDKDVATILVEDRNSWFMRNCEDCDVKLLTK